MKYFVYILKSIKDSKLYIGQTADLEDRVKRHNEGRVISTKNRRPFEIVYYEEFSDRSLAVKREKFFKSFKKPQYILEKFVAPSSRG